MAADAMRSQKTHTRTQSQITESTPLLGALPNERHNNVLVEDIDSRFRRWKRAVAQRMSKGKGKLPDEPTVLISVFDGGEASGRSDVVGLASSLDLLFGDVEAVRFAIQEGILPKMITTGSSGSYFARRKDSHGKVKICGVFKPADEEPYGNLNPKRAFLRRYFWWAMGRPCLIAGFSAMSEAGASLLDDRLNLGLVPATRLVNISSPSFHYEYKDRMAYEHHGQELPEKMGSFQSFLHGYTMASTFLRSHPFPTRPRSVMERDLAAEQRAHRKSRKQYSARLRKVLVKLKYICLCRQGLEDIQFDATTDIYPEDLRQQAASKDGDEDNEDDDDFLWTPELLQSFRLELEKLVVFDYLCRNTDRGLDNFMVKHSRQKDSSSRGPSISLGAIDNSLAWPIKHPDGIREYPFGWLYLPADVIGGPFAQSTRDRFLPLLSSPQWWRDTEEGLRNLFQQDEHFNAKLFESQMAVFKGQGWNLVQSLKSADEGPLELCARPKKVVHSSLVIMTEEELQDVPQGHVALLKGHFAPASEAGLLRPTPAGAQHSTPTRPIAVQPAQSAASQSGLAEGAHPRSLPETSAFSKQTIHPVADGLAAATTPMGPGSLGIEVVEAMDRASRKRNQQRSGSRQRPPLGNTVSGSRRGSRDSNTLAGDDSPSRPSQRWGRHNSRRYTFQRPSARRGGSVGTNVGDVLSEDEEDQHETQNPRGEMDGDLASSMLSEPDLSVQRPADNEVTQSALDRLASSDYFASYHGRVEPGRPQMRSIDSHLSDAQDLDVRAKGNQAAGAAGFPSSGAVGSLRGQLGKTTPNGEDGAPSKAATASQPPHARRRRMRSVGHWSLHSFGSLYTAHRDEDAEEDDAHPDPERLGRRIKAIVERLVDDKSLPWQAWLRA